MCFILMLCMVAMAFKYFQVFFQVFQKHVSSVSTAFKHMLQLLYLDASKVNQVLHLSSPPYVALSLPAPAGHPNDAASGSFRIGGTTPFLSCRLGGAGPAWCTN
jgi:hypothetical protein